MAAAMQGQDGAQTLTEALAAAGYAHRAAADSLKPYAHVVYDARTGVTVGVMDAQEAWDFLAAGAAR